MGDLIFFASNINGNLCFRARSDYCENCLAKLINDLDDNKYDIICSASFGCYGFDLVSTDSNIYCSGYSSCDNANISNTNVVYCNGYLTHQESYFYNVNYVYCTAYQSCVNAFFGVANIYALGNSAMNALVYSNGVGILKVELLAYYCATGTNIFCNYENDICHVYCGCSYWH